MAAARTALRQPCHQWCCSYNGSQRWVGLEAINHFEEEPVVACKTSPECPPTAGDNGHAKLNFQALECENCGRRYVAVMICEVKRTFQFQCPSFAWEGILEAHEDSDIDIAVFSEAFGPPDHREFCGVLSEAKWTTAPLIEACGFHPSVLEQVHPVSFLHEIVSTGEVVYQRAAAEWLMV